MVAVARCLSEQPIQIVTNSIPVAQVFWKSNRANVILTGGYLYPRLGVQLGPISEKCGFLGCAQTATDKSCLYRI